MGRFLGRCWSRVGAWTGSLKNHTKWRLELERRSNFFISSVHLCAVTYITEISLDVTLSNQSRSLTLSLIFSYLAISRLCYLEWHKGRHCTTKHTSDQIDGQCWRLCFSYFDVWLEFPVLAYRYLDAHCKSIYWAACMEVFVMRFIQIFLFLDRFRVLSETTNLQSGYMWASLRKQCQVQAPRHNWWFWPAQNVFCQKNMI